jgi:Protein of unknown function (DUF3147)
MVSRFLRALAAGWENVVKKIEVNLASLKQTRPHEYLSRFVFGGLCTVIAGLIAKRFGPGIGGLFLAFPAIFPASATMIENHEKKRKVEIGADGTNRGRLAASIDASGAVLGCVGLAGFGTVLWKELPFHNSYVIVSTATLAWAVIAYTMWAIRKS